MDVDKAIHPALKPVVMACDKLINRQGSGAVWRAVLYVYVHESPIMFLYRVDAYVSRTIIIMCTCNACIQNFDRSCSLSGYSPHIRAIFKSNDYMMPSIFQKILANNQLNSNCNNIVYVWCAFLSILFSLVTRNLLGRYGAVNQEIIRNKLRGLQHQ